MVSLTVPNNFLARTISNAKPTAMEGFVHGALLCGAGVTFRHVYTESTIVSSFCQTRVTSPDTKCAQFEAWRGDDVSMEKGHLAGLRTS